MTAELAALERRIAALEKRGCNAQLVIWDKEHDRILAEIASLRDRAPLSQAGKDRLSLLKARRDELRPLLNIKY